MVYLLIKVKFSAWDFSFNTFTSSRMKKEGQTLKTNTNVNSLLHLRISSGTEFNLYFYLTWVYFFSITNNYLAQSFRVECSFSFFIIHTCKIMILGDRAIDLIRLHNSSFRAFRMNTTEISCFAWIYDNMIQNAIFLNSIKINMFYSNVIDYCCSLKSCIRLLVQIYYL